MKAPAYPKYKASGVEWLGGIPEHWEVKAIKWESPVLRGASPRPIDDPNYFDEEGKYAWVRISDVTTAGMYLSQTEQRLSTLGSSLSVKLQPGALFLSIAATVGKPAITKIKCCIHDGFVYFPRFKGDPRFLFYVFASGEPYKGLGKLGTQLNLNTDTVGSIVAGFPKVSEQRTIADFLDAETTKVDTLLAKKRELIEKLKEKRTALISRTVTRGLPPEAARAAGLNPNPKLKPSGIEWLDDVPEHWDVVQLFRVTAVIQTGPFGSQLHHSDYVDEGVPLINPSHLIEDRIVPDDQDTVTDETARRLMRHRLMAGDVVFARRGEIGRCAVVGEEESGWLCGTGSMIIRLRDCDARYFARVFRSAGFSALLTLNAVGTTMLNLNPSIVGRMRVPLPPLPEQCAISNYLDRETSKMDRMVEKVEAAIERLQEYRTALITAAVTGKIDVRTKH